MERVKKESISFIMTKIKKKRQTKGIDKEYFENRPLRGIGKSLKGCGKKVLSMTKSENQRNDGMVAKTLEEHSSFPFRRC